MAAFHSFFNSMYKVPLNAQEIKKEINIVYQTDEENGSGRNTRSKIENKMNIK